MKSSLGVLPNKVGSAYLPILVEALSMSTTTSLLDIGLVVETSGIHVDLLVKVVFRVVALYEPAASLV